MISIMIAATVVLAVLLGAIVGVPMLQQRRMLRVRARFGGRLLKAQDEERAALARDLHDDVVQRLVSSAMELRVNAATASATQAIAVAERIDAVASDLRNLARRMHPSAVERVGLSEALRDLCETVAESDGLQVAWRETTATTAGTAAERLALYRVAQEALQNIVRHAGVQTARMELAQRPDGIELLIADDGRGFDPDAALQGRGLGLTSIQERIALLGGRVRITSSPGRGTAVMAHIDTGSTHP